MQSSNRFNKVAPLIGLLASATLPQIAVAAPDTSRENPSLPIQNKGMVVVSQFPNGNPVIDFTTLKEPAEKRAYSNWPRKFQSPHKALIPQFDGGQKVVGYALDSKYVLPSDKPIIFVLIRKGCGMMPNFQEQLNKVVKQLDGAAQFVGICTGGDVDAVQDYLIRYAKNPKQATIFPVIVDEGLQFAPLIPTNPFGLKDTSIYDARTGTLCVVGPEGKTLLSRPKEFFSPFLTQKTADDLEKNIGIQAFTMHPSSPQYIASSFGVSSDVFKTLDVRMPSDPRCAPGYACGATCTAPTKIK